MRGPHVIEKGGEGGSYPRAGLFKWARHGAGNGFGKRASLLSPRAEKVFSARRYNDRGG